MIIREFNPTDIDGIQQVALTSWKLDRYHSDNKLDPVDSDKYWAEVAIGNCRNPDCITFVAEDNGKVVGFINLIENKPLSKKFSMKYGSISLLGVDNEYQGKGIGTSLVRRAVEYFKENGFKKIDVATDCANISAIRAYLKNGFYPIHHTVMLTLDL